MRIRLLLICLLVLSALTCTGAHKEAKVAQSDELRDPLKVAISAAKRHGFEPITSSLVEIETVQLRALRGPCYRVVVRGVIPPHELVLAVSGDRLMETSVDSLPELSAIEAVVKASRLDPQGIAPSDLASDLVFLAFGKQPTEPTALMSIEDIPTHLEGSDVFRDLRIAGLSSADIRAKLLDPVLEVGISPPSFSGGPATSLTFWSWSYFGGTLNRWSVPLDSRGKGKIRVEEVARGVGSFDLRM